MTAFSAACDVLFEDVNLAVDAQWWSALGGPPVACRIILARPDQMTGFGEAQIVSDTVRLDMRVSEIAAPADGDWIVIGSERYVLQGEPRRDRLRLVWQCQATPEC